MSSAAYIRFKECPGISSVTTQKFHLLAYRRQLDRSSFHIDPKNYTSAPHPASRPACKDAGDLDLVYNVMAWHGCRVVTLAPARVSGIRDDNDLVAVEHDDDLQCVNG